MRRFADDQSIKDTAKQRADSADLLSPLNEAYASHRIDKETWDDLCVFVLESRNSDSVFVRELIAIRSGLNANQAFDQTVSNTYVALVRKLEELGFDIGLLEPDDSDFERALERALGKNTTPDGKRLADWTSIQATHDSKSDEHAARREVRLRAIVEERVGFTLPP